MGGAPKSEVPAPVPPPGVGVLDLKRPPPPSFVPVPVSGAVLSVCFAAAFAPPLKRPPPGVVAGFDALNSPPPPKGLGLFVPLAVLPVEAVVVPVFPKLKPPKPPAPLVPLDPVVPAVVPNAGVVVDPPNIEGVEPLPGFAAPNGPPVPEAGALLPVDVPEVLAADPVPNKLVAPVADVPNGFEAGVEAGAF